MKMIRVIPEALRFLSNHFKRSVLELQTLDTYLGNALTSLDWEMLQKAGLESQVTQARRQAQILYNQAEDFDHFLQRKAQMFEEADRHGMQALQQITKPYLAAQKTASKNPAYHFPAQSFQNTLSLGKLMVDKESTLPQFVTPIADYPIEIPATYAGIRYNNRVFTHLSEFLKQFNSLLDIHQV